MPAYVPALVGSFAFTESDGQAELTWLDGYILKQFTEVSK